MSAELAGYLAHGAGAPTEVPDRFGEGVICVREGFEGGDVGAASVAVGVFAGGEFKAVPAADQKSSQPIAQDAHPAQTLPIRE